MAAPNPSQFNEAQMQEYFRAELDGLPIVETVADRLCLVADNFAVTSEWILDEYAQSVPSHHLREAYAEGLQYNLAAIRNDADQARAMRYTQPLYVAAVGLQRLLLLLNNYAAYAPLIFKGYTPVSSYLDWAEKLQMESVRNFGRREERLILLANDMAAEGVYSCRTYSELCHEGIRRGKIRST